MDSFRDVTILVFLLGFLATCLGSHTKASKAGNSYIHGSELSSLNKILKAVLVHESTSHGLYSGSISNVGPNGGDDFKVTKQSRYSGGQNSGYSYSANQQVKANPGLKDLTTIRVFHESSGNTGKIHPKPSMAPYVQLVKVVMDYSPPNFGIPTPSHNSASALSRSGSDFVSSQVQQSFLPTGNAGDHYPSSEQQLANANTFYGAPRQAEGISGVSPNENRGIVTSSGSAFNQNQNSLLPSTGYQYLGPFQASNRGFDNKNIGHVGSQAYNGVFPINISGNPGSGSASSGYQYSQQNQAPDRDYPRNPPSETLQYENSGRIKNGGLVQSSTNSGYRYQSPKDANANAGLLINGEAEQVAISQYSSTTQQNSPNHRYRYENSGAVQNIGPQIGFQYSSQSAPGNVYQSSQSGQSQNTGPVQSGYRYDRPTEAFNTGYQLEQPGSSEPVFRGQPFLPLPSREFESPKLPQNEDCRPESSRPSTVFRGQPYLPISPADKLSSHHLEGPKQNAENERYNNPEVTSRPTTIFKDVPYLSLPATFSHQLENPKPSQSNGYRYDKPDLSRRPSTTFKGQPYLPSTPVSGRW